VRVVDILSGKPILGDAEAFKTRFHTVFRESGPTLELAVRARALLTSERDSSRSYVLDLELQSSLVTPVGPMLDGSLGLRGPRVQELWALYEVQDGLVTNLWLMPAKGDDGRGEAALNSLYKKKEWSAFDAILRRQLGAGYVTTTGPLCSLSIGRFEMQGRRNTMEDMLSIERLPADHLARPADSCLHFLGLYDGHGGAACATYAAENLHKHLQRRLNAVSSAKDFNAHDTFREAFEETEKAFLKDSQSASGSCALTLLVGGGKMYIAHLGDSRAVLGVGPQAEAVRLTEDHKPDSASEKIRCESAGGSVIMGGRCWRITHDGTAMMLATSRSLGDRTFKDSWERVATAAVLERTLDREAALEAAQQPMADEGDCLNESHAVTPLLSAVPDVSVRELTDEDKFIVLACDGVWDVLSDQEACRCVRTALIESQSAEAAARKLAGMAFNLGSEDNISVIIAIIRHELA